MRNLLVQIEARDPKTGSITTLRMSSLGASAAGTVLDGHAWTPCIRDWGERSISIFSSGELQPATVSHGDVVFLVSSDFDNQAWAGLSFDGRPVEMWIGEDGADFSEYEQVFAGSCGALARNGLECTLGLAGPDAKLAKDLLSASYTGEGALNGDPEIKGSLKPWCSGEAKNISGVLISENYWVYQYHAYGPTGGVQGVYENAWPVASGPSATVDSYGALIGLDLQPGQWAHCPAQGLYRLGGQPSGLITADVIGATVNGSPLLTVGEIVRHLLSTRVTADEIDASTFAPFTQAWSLYVDSQVSVGDQVREAMRQAGGYLLPDQSGRWIAGDFYGEGTAGELRGDRTAEPLVETYSQLASAPPAYRVKVGHDRSWTVHSDDQISPLLLDITDEEARAAAADAAAKAEAAGQKADQANDKADGATDNVENVRRKLPELVRPLLQEPIERLSALHIQGAAVQAKATVALHEQNLIAIQSLATRIEDDGALVAEQVTQLTTRVENSEDRIESGFLEINRTIADADEALAESITAQIANFGEDVNASINEERIARTTAVDAVARDLDEMSGRMSTLSEDLSGEILDSRQLTIDKDGAMARRVDALGVRIDDEVADRSAAIRTVEEAVADETEARASAIQTIESTYGDRIAAIEIEASTATDALDNLNAQYTVKVQSTLADGTRVLGGFGVANQNGVVDTAFMTDAFRIYTPGVAPRQVFYADGDGVKMTNVEVDKLKAGTIDFEFINRQSLQNAFGGYQVLPGGLIIMWGQVRMAINDEQIIPVTFPTPFTTALMSLTATPYIATANNYRDLWIQTTATRSLTGASFYCQAATGNQQRLDGFDWMAFGY